MKFHLVVLALADGSWRGSLLTFRDAMVIVLFILRDPPRHGVRGTAGHPLLLQKIRNSICDSKRDHRPHVSLRHVLRCSLSRFKPAGRFVHLRLCNPLVICSRRTGFLFGAREYFFYPPRKLPCRSSRAFLRSS